MDSDEEIPVVTGHFKKGWDEEDLQKLAHPKLLGGGGGTIADELELLRREYAAAEERAASRESRLHSATWDGDVYIGPRWNTLSVLYAIGMAAPAAAGLFAWLSYGTLWATGEFY